MENTEIIKTDDKNIIIERTTIDKELDVSFLRSELDGCLLLLEEQEQIQKRLSEKMDDLDDEIKQIIQEKINKVEENKRWNLIRIAELSEKLK